MALLRRWGLLAALLGVTAAVVRSLSRKSDTQVHRINQ
jgi:hypothetical protein